MKKQSGFTLVELLIATAFLAFIIMFATLAYVQISRSFNRGVTVKRTQESTRDIIQDIASTIQSTSYNPTGPSITFDSVDTFQVVCIDNVRYLWHEGPRPSNDPEASVYKDISFTDCYEDLHAGNIIDTALLDPKLMVQDLVVEQLHGSIAFRINLIVSVNEEMPDLLNGSGATAKCNVLNGDQFCDVASLSTVVTLRR